LATFAPVWNASTLCVQVAALLATPSDGPLFVAGIFFTIARENYQIWYKDSITGKTPHTIFPAGYLLSEILL
jgi:hypothetical protein